MEGNTVNRLHLIYGYAIAILVIIAIIICWVLSCKGYVSENAFQNFSFAASIVSIVLALVSIVYTIYSGGNVTNSVGVLQEAEKNIEQQVSALNGLEARIIDSVEKGNNQVSKKLSEVQNQIEPMVRGALKSVNSQANSSEDLIDINYNSAIGNAIIYICIKSIEQNKPWPTDILGNEIKMYIQGYIVAMASIPAIKFYYETESDFQIIKTCNFTDFELIKGMKQNIMEVIKHRLGNEQSTQLFKTIDDYFANASEKK